MVVVLIMYQIAAAFLALTAAVKGRDLARDPDNGAVRALLQVAVTMAVTLTLIVLEPALDVVHGAAAVSSTVWHLGAMWAATQFECFLLHTTHNPDRARLRVRRRLIAFGVAASIVVVASLIAPDSTKESNFRVADDSVAAAAWQVAFVALVGWALADGLLLVLRHSRRAVVREVRVGLRLMGFGAASGLVFVVGKVLTALIQCCELGDRVVPGALLVTAVAVAVTSMWAGVLYAGLAPRVRAIPRWCRRRRQHRELYPLWNDLRAVPGLQRWVHGIAVVDSAAGDALSIRHFQWRLYRRVIEIADMQLHLRPWRSAEVAATAHRVGQDAALDDTELGALVHAAVLSEAMRARCAGAASRDQTMVRLTLAESATLDESATWYCRVQQARRSALLRQVEAESRTGT